MNLCECGCGQEVRNRFAQGHSSKYDTTPEERFWKWTEKRGADDCWLWKGATRNGYGVNPEHLFVGTRSVNMKDMYAKGKGKGGNKGRNNALLTDTQITEIRQSVAQGMSQVAVSLQFNISKAYVCLLVNGKRRRNKS